MTRVETMYGQLEGAEADGIHVFKGIPFAKPPVGALRWASPQKPATWTGIREARAFGPAALQAESPMAAMLGFDTTNTGEDCLYLNVWTPAPDEGKRPVMVFIHGGAFVIGAGSQAMYDGTALAKRGDVVMVTINYRLGALGFLRLRKETGDAVPATGNEAILDQLAALEWVRDNIASFGGDPDNVTIFGESAGAISISALLASPRADGFLRRAISALFPSSRSKGLFRRAILQSGSANLCTTAVAADDVANKVLADLGTTDPGELRGLPAERIIKAQNQATPRTGGVSYAPVADGETIATDPFAAIRKGSAAGVDILIGTNRDEMNLFRFMDPSIEQLDEAGTLARMTDALGGDEKKANEAAGVYQEVVAARNETSGWPRTFLAFQTDQVFRAPAMRLAEAQASHHANVYAYRFDWASPALGGVLGASHALDLPFIFGTLGSPGISILLGGVKPEMRALSEQMMDAWLAFARTGNPGTESLPQWPRYTRGGRSTMLFKLEPAVSAAPEERARGLWD